MAHRLADKMTSEFDIRVMHLMADFNYNDNIKQPTNN